MMTNDPVIIIGCGRSGSTLLANGILDAHPDFYMPAECTFMLPKLYDLLWGSEYLTKTKISSYVNKDAHPELMFMEFVKNYQADPSKYEELYEKFTDVEHRRVIEIVRNTFLKTVKPEIFTETHWGIKEIWNGINGQDYDWNIYNACYPQAKWIHLVRNPFDFSRSNLSWNGLAINSKSLTQQLENWVNVTNKSHEQSSQNYFEIRYEDLISNTDEIVSSVFDFIGIELHDNCFKAIKYDYHRSNSREKLPSIRPEKIKGLTQLMDRYGYSSP